MDCRLPNTPIQSNFFGYIPFFQNSSLLLIPMLVLVDLFLFLYFDDDLEYHRVLAFQETFVGYDQIITNGVKPVSLELVLP